MGACACYSSTDLLIFLFRVMHELCAWDFLLVLLLHILIYEKWILFSHWIHFVHQSSKLWQVKFSEVGIYYIYILSTFCRPRLIYAQRLDRPIKGLALRLIHYCINKFRHCLWHVKSKPSDSMDFSDSPTLRTLNSCIPAYYSSSRQIPNYSFYGIFLLWRNKLPMPTWYAWSSHYRQGSIQQ